MVSRGLLPDRSNVTARRQAWRTPSGELATQLDTVVSFTAKAFDQFNVPRSTGGDSIQVSLSPAGVATLLALTDLRNGSYAVQVLGVGLGTVSVRLIVGGEPVAHAAIALSVVSPLCNAEGTVLDSSRTTCLCAPGYGVISFDDGTAHCGPCAEGTVLGAVFLGYAMNNTTGTI